MAKKKKDTSEPKKEAREAGAANPLEGEGSYSGTKAYDEGVREFIEEEDVDALAEKAREEYEADEPGYRKAEEIGKERAAEEDPELFRHAKKGEPTLE
jgi:hypothetical protein